WEAAEVVLSAHLFELAYVLLGADFAIADGGDTCRIIASILEILEGLNQKRCGGTVADIADYSAH
ncbi:MAG: hypothetical protein LUO86_05950, partial [Methanomicrobiales archaeon]|nr:hypothetical protein [Methanomicrobiales archaeon]